VKRRGKSPPLQAQARRHGKPHRVQGQIGDRGAARSTFRASGTGSGYWLLRQMVLSVPQGMQTEFGLQPFQNHFPPTSQILTVLSRHPPAIWLASGERATLTDLSDFKSVMRSLGPAASSSHNLTGLSRPPLARNFPSGEKASEQTGPIWGVKMLSGRNASGQPFCGLQRHPAGLT